MAYQNLCHSFLFQQKLILHKIIHSFIHSCLLNWFYIFLAHLNWIKLFKSQKIPLPGLSEGFFGAIFKAKRTKWKRRFKTGTWKTLAFVAAETWTIYFCFFVYSRFSKLAVFGGVFELCIINPRFETWITKAIVSVPIFGIYI